MDERTSGYIVREEDKREKIRTKMVRRAIRRGWRKEVTIDGQENVGRRVRKEEKRMDQCGRSREKVFTKKKEF